MTEVVVCNQICLGTCLWFFMKELIQMKGMGATFYFKDTNNLKELALQGLYFVYYYIRTTNPNQIIFPKDLHEQIPKYGRCDKSDSDYKKCETYMKQNPLFSQEQLSILTFLIALLSFVNTFLYLRIFPKFG